VSGGLEEEVAEALAHRGLAEAFNEIHGSPRRKEQIFQTLADRGELRDAVYFGDARYDYEVAHQFGVHFVFVSHCTEFEQWQSYFESRDVRIVTTLEEITVAVAPA
jgi:phosphoglycolate phosphatase-like HAD superfamily hydrolase